MHHLAAVGQHRRLDQFVVAVDRQRLGLLVDQRLEEGEEVLGVEQRGRSGDPARHVEMADDLDVVCRGDDLAGDGALDIAAALDGEIDDHRAGLHRRDHGGRHQLRRRTAGDQRRGDDDVLLGDVLGGQRRLLGLVFLRHFLGVAAGGLGGLELLVLDGEELRAERGDLLLGGGTHVGGGDHRAEAARRGDGLQAGDADAHDEHLGGGHGAGGGHHHRHGAVVDRGAVDDRLVAGEVGLRGQHVHRLGAADARHEFHGEGGDAGLGHGGDRGVVAIGVHGGDDGRARLVALELGVGRPAHLQHDVGLGGVGSLADGGARLGEFVIGDARGGAGAGFDDHREAQPGIPLDRIGRGRDARLTGFDFLRNEDRLSHRKILSAGTGPAYSPDRNGRASVEMT